MALNGDATTGAGVGGRPYKLPVSVLVLVHTPKLDVLLLERADRPGFWQSVTGSQVVGETLEETAARELFEETALDATRYRLVDWGKHNVFEIYPNWRYRYAPGVTHNTEHVFALEVPEAVPVTLAPREHTAYAWMPWREAADRAFSWTNAEAILELPVRTAGGHAAAGGT
ncbi:MAG TPA: dihydroneopterin triphosphate diphosphatase [Burkholderiales bacterium]|nr:dihydroneopterin triphosphate diphosphatase [Burkholderiales bacterium]